jgi:hypothetical protein
MYNHSLLIWKENKIVAQILASHDLEFEFCDKSDMYGNKTFIC